jgi:DNA-binding CsgD family transcriptional regulator/PAS domain-containing protein
MPVSYERLMPRRELACTPIYNEFFLPGGMEEALGSMLLSNGSFVTGFALYRPARKGPFDRSDEEFLRSLIAHLQRALQLNIRLASLEMHRAASAEILDRLSQASLLVDAASRVLFANSAAEEILGDRTGLHRDADGTLRNRRVAETSRLHKLIANAQGRATNGYEGDGGSVRLSRGETRAPLIVLVIPLRAETSWLLPRRPAAILFITDPERINAPKAASLQQSFGLTRAEAAAALEVLKGHGLQAAASALGVSQVTVRTHLTAIFGKTGTRRQAELVRFLLQGKNGIRE